MEAFLARLPVKRRSRRMTSGRRPRR